VVGIQGHDAGIPDKLDLEVVHGFLNGESYWAMGRSLDVMCRALEHSLCFGVYAGDEPVQDLERWMVRPKARRSEEAHAR
jgi:hypothetical protein